MKTLILYASKTGTTQDCARSLAQEIPDSTLVDLCAQKPDPSGYDQVIVGGSIRMGTLHVDARQYLEGAQSALMKKRLGVFICAAYEEKAEQLFAANVPQALRAHAVECACFGGAIRMDRRRGFEKLIARMAMRATKGERAQMPHVHPERIEAFAARFVEA